MTPCTHLARTCPSVQGYPLRVLHVIPSIAARYGGTTQAVLGICRALSVHGKVVTEIATTDADGPRGRLPRHGPNPCLHNGTPVWLFPRTISESWKYSRGLGAWLAAHVSDYDLLHVHGVFSYVTMAACRAAARRHVPAVLSPHGMLSPYSLRRSTVRKSLYLRAIEYRSLRSVRFLHATSPEEQRELAEFLPAVRAVCISLGLDEDVWIVPRVPGQFRNKYGIPHDRPLLLFLSRLHRKKGLVELLLPALAELPEEVMLAVVGGDDANDRDYGPMARNATVNMGLKERVIFTGPIYSPDKWAAYDDADLYVLPSFHENFGITAMEAMARGVPSVLSCEVQSSSLLLDARAGQVVPPDRARLVQAIAQLLKQSRATRLAMAQCGMAFALQNLRWSHTAQRMTELYRRCAG